LNGSFRDECLNTNWFLSLEDATQRIEDWREEYNTFRLHSCLVNLTPEMFIKNKVKKANFSNFTKLLKLGERQIDRIFLSFSLLIILKIIKYLN